MTGPPDAKRPRDPSPGADSASAHQAATTRHQQGTSEVGQVPGQASFDDLPAVARVTDPGTSWAASRDPSGHRRRIIDTYVVTFARAGARGLTTHEVCARHGGESAHVARRITDMWKLGWVHHVGERRSPRTGRWQRAYAITDTGMRYAAGVLARKAAS